MSNKMTYANSADPDQTAPQGAVRSGLHCLPFHYVLWETTALTAKFRLKKVWNKVFEILRHLSFHITLNLWTPEKFLTTPIFYYMMCLKTVGWVPNIDQMLQTCAFDLIRSFTAQSKFEQFQFLLPIDVSKNCWMSLFDFIMITQSTVN